MYKQENNKTTITCDKCGNYQVSISNEPGHEFYKSGWSVNPRAKKYIHVCRNCQPKSQKDAHDFVAAKFNL